MRVPFPTRRPPPGTGGPIPPQQSYTEPPDVGSWGVVRPQPVPSPNTSGVPNATPFGTTLQWLIRALGLTSNVVPQGLGQLPLDPMLDVFQRGWAVATWQRMSVQIAPTAPPEADQLGLLFAVPDTQIVTAMSAWNDNDDPSVITVHRQLLIDGDVHHTMSLRSPVLAQTVIPGLGSGAPGTPSNQFLSWAALNGDADGVWVFPPNQQMWVEVTFAGAGDGGNVNIDFEVATLPGMFQGR